MVQMQDWTGHIFLRYTSLDFDILFSKPFLEDGGGERSKGWLSESGAQQEGPLLTGRSSPGLGTNSFPLADSSGPDITVATKSNLT